jgi:hypothetical protein
MTIASAGTPGVSDKLCSRQQENGGARQTLMEPAAAAAAALHFMNLWAQQDSNLQPRDYESRK